MPRAIAWPPELRRPITKYELLGTNTGLFGLSRQEISELFGLDQQPSDTANHTSNDDGMAHRYSAECRRRIDVMLNFFGIDRPTDDAGWESVIIRLCVHWGIPAFEVAMKPRRGPGAPKSWTSQRYCQLFADVMALASKGRLSEHAACKHIADNQSKYGKRYLRIPARTLHRQFSRAKHEIKTNNLFRHAYFSRGGLGLLDSPDYGAELLAIERYAIAQKF
jgi:hypothetical protein